MSDFFDEISRKAEARRNLSFEKQKTLLNSGILTPSMTNDSLDGNLTDEQIAEKKAMIEAKEQQAYNDAIGVPFGVVEGAAGLLGDVELLGQGIKGAYNAERGKKWDGFVEGLSDRDTMFWTTQDNMERTDRWLEGTELGDRLKDGSGGRLVGEILAPIPVPSGVMQAGKIGAKIATHPMTRYTIAKAANEVGNITQGGKGIMDGSEFGRGGMTPYNPLKLPQSNMVIGQGSTKFDFPSYNEFKKQIDVEAVMKNRKKTGKFAPTPEEQRLWEETSKRGNPTFIDADGIIKQEIPTGTMNLKAPLLKGQPQYALRNSSLNSYKLGGKGLDKKTRLSYMSDLETQRTGASAFVNGNDIQVNPNLSKTDFSNSLAHEAQHMIQDAENLNGANWSTGSSPDLFTGKRFDQILERAEEAEEIFSKEFNKLLKEGKVTEDEYFDIMEEVTPGFFSAQVKKDALLSMRDYDNLKFGEKSKGHFFNNGDKPYFADAGELTPRVTGARAHLNKKGITDNHILNAMDEDFKRLGFTTKDMYPPEVLERFKSGKLRDQSVIDELNKTEYGQMLDDELTKFNASNFKQAIKDTIKKRKHPKVLQNGGFKVNDISGTMGHGYEVKFTMDGSDWSFGIPSTPRNPEGAARNILHNVGKFFTKGSDWYLDKDLADIIVKPGDDVSRKLLSNSKASKRTSYSIDPDSYFGELAEESIPKTRQNQITKLVKTAKGTEIEKPLSYTGNPMLDSNWDSFVFSSQKPGKEVIKYRPDNSLHNRGLAGPSKLLEDVPPMNNVLDRSGGVTQQPSIGLNSEAMSNMNPIEAAKFRGVRGFMELKEELRTLYKEATGDPAMQRQIRDRIVEVDKQMNAFDPDVAKSKKSLHEHDAGEFGEQAVYESDKSGTSNIDKANRLADADDTHFTGKYGVTDNADNISDISIQGGKSKTDLIENPPVMNTVKDNNTINSINSALKNTRATPDENINSIMRVISDLQAQSVPKLQKTREPFLRARDEMLNYAYDAMEAIQRAAYRGTDSAETGLARMPDSRLDNITENVSTVSPSKTKPRYDDPTEYEFDEMLRSWEKEAKNIKTRNRYLPNGKRLDRSKLRDFEDPAQGVFPDYGRGRIKKKDNDFFGEIEQPRTSYSITPTKTELPRSLTHGSGSRKNDLIKIPDSKTVDGVRVNAKTGHPMGTDEEILKAKAKVNEKARVRDRNKVNGINQQQDIINHSSAVKEYNNIAGITTKRKPFQIPESKIVNGQRVNVETNNPMLSDDEIKDLVKKANEAKANGDHKLKKQLFIQADHAKGITKKSNMTANQSWFKDLPKKVQQEYFDFRERINKYKFKNKTSSGLNVDENIQNAWMTKYHPTFAADVAARAGERRALILKRTPKGQTKADKEAIKELYRKAKKTTKETGTPHHVDHIFPLKPVKFTTRDGRKVTLKQGWHEPENLTVMNGSENMSKGNRILPEQYEEIIKRLNPQDKIDFMEWYRLKGFYD